MNLTPQQIEIYWTKRLGRPFTVNRPKIAVRCVLHDDKTPSATIFTEGNSAFNCNGCGRHGNIFQFEALYSKCDLAQAELNIAEITGARAETRGGWRQVATYDYRDAEGHVVFQKRKYWSESEGRKSYKVFHPKGSGWEHGIGEAPRVLYNLPDLVTANVICLVEGEKDCETLTGIQLYPESPHLRQVATCNFDGAWRDGESPKWLSSYNSYFAGKFVLVFPDNDEPGETRGLHIARMLYNVAAGVKVVRLPALPDKGDVSDWLLTHTVEQLRAEIKAAPRWHPEAPAEGQSVFLPAPKFMALSTEEIEWWVKGVIQKGANGLIVADPGAGKSWLALDLAISLATGNGWMGLPISAPIKVGYCAREDNPALTSWRLKHLFRGKAIDCAKFESNLWINSRAQTPQLLLNSEPQVQELISAIRDRELKLVLLDVFSVLHNVNENKAEEIAPILEACRRIQRESGCAVGLVHHLSKTEGGMMSRIRGSSALRGWGEWIIGVEYDPQTKIRTASFGKVKAGAEGDPISFVIEQRDNVVQLQVLSTVTNQNVRSGDYKAMAAGGNA